MAYGLKYPDHPSKLILASTQAYLDVERSIAAFGKLGGDAAEAAARTFLTERVDAESSMIFNEHCMPVYNPTPQPPRSTIIFQGQSREDIPRPRGHLAPDGLSPGTASH